MTIVSYGPASLKLPARIRNTNSAMSEFETRLALVDRIAELQGIETVDSGNDSVPHQVDVYLRQNESRAVRKSTTPRLFCSLNCHGVTIFGLDRSSRHHVLVKGWGRLIADQVLIFLPRDDRELEVVWQVLQRAYDELFFSLADRAEARAAATWDLPKFSRSNLQ